MQPSLQLDHVVLVVDQLDAAMRRFEDLGFTVIPGGEHPAWKTHNALMAFEDGSYLELLAARDRAAAIEAGRDSDSAMNRRFAGHIAAGPGLADYALYTTHLGVLLAAARARGLGMDGPNAGSRQRPDGQQLHWATAVPSTGDVPFVIADQTDRDLRVPSGAVRRHANGVTGIVGLSVAVPDRMASARRYSALLGNEGMPKPPPELTIGGCRIRLVEPTPTDTALRRHIANHGPRPWRLTLQTRSAAAIGVLSSDKTGGAAIELVTGPA